MLDRLHAIRSLTSKVALGVAVAIVDAHSAASGNLELFAITPRCTRTSPETRKRYPLET